MKLLDKAIALAWEQAMATTHGRTLLASGEEVEITAMLQDALSQLLGNETLPGFSPAIFGAPIRGQELDDYITDGVMRFQNGNYAWAMPHAGMIGYVAAGHHTGAKDALAKKWFQVKPAPCAPLFAMVEDRSMSPVVVISTHSRSFVLRNGEAPGNIMLRHIWLSEPSSTSTVS
ncbi:hypothetical protein FACS189475_01470 [Betaproteobacteria bacterium]|nr:hypothetical protein FACS189475_01470 [Betaproteobacteria bacterium]